MGRNRLAIKSISDDNFAKAGLQIYDIAGQAKDCHDLGSDRDIEAVFPRNALHAAAETVHDVAELAVIHVHCALPGDLLDIDAELVALLYMVVQHGGKEVIGCADGMEVAGEVEVDVLHGNDLRVAAAGRAAFDAEDRAQGRLTERHDGLLADLAQAVCQADAGRGLAFARGRGGDGGHQDQLAVGGVRMVLEVVVVDLCLVVAVLLDVLLVDPEGSCDLCDLLRRCFLRDLDVRLESHGSCTSFISKKHPGLHRFPDAVHTIVWFPHTSCRRSPVCIMHNFVPSRNRRLMK